MLRQISDLAEIDADTPLYICPAGNAGEKLYQVLSAKRPDVSISGFLDTYRDDERCGLKISLIDSGWDDVAHNVIVAIERQEIRNNLLDKLAQKNINDLLWVGSDFSLKEIPEESVNDKTLYFIYDLRVNPLNYEFVVSLCHADVERLRLQCESIYVVIVKPEGHELFDLSRTAIKNTGNGLESDNDWFLNNVLTPSCALLPSINAVSVIPLHEIQAFLESKNTVGRFPAEYRHNHPVELKSTHFIFGEHSTDAAFHQLPITASSAAIKFVKQWLAKKSLQGKKVVVITLREAMYQTERNSVATVWRCFAEKIIEEGYTPVFVRDTFADFVDDDYENFPVFHEACWNIMLRVALYELAFLNMIVNTGPAVFCVLNNRVRYLLFNHLATEGYVGSEKYHRESGSRIGSQYIAKKSYQQAVWGGADSCETIKSEFNMMCKKIDMSGSYIDE